MFLSGANVNGCSLSCLARLCENAGVEIEVCYESGQSGGAPVGERMARRD
jgi:hypothetical protein